MDLHLTDAQATAEECAAVDSELGLPESGWQGGHRQSGETRAVSNGNAVGKRHRLLPVLHAIQNRIGWISPGALNYVALRLDVAPAEVYGVASFYGMFSLTPRPQVVAHVCDDIACVTRGSDKLCAELEDRLGPEGSACSDHRVGGELVGECGVRGIREHISDWRYHRVVGNKYAAGHWLLKIRIRLVENAGCLLKRISEAQRHMGA